MGISFDHSAVPHIMCISYTVLSKGQSPHLSNSWNRDILEKLMVARGLYRLHALYRTRMLICCWE